MLLNSRRDQQHFTIYNKYNNIENRRGPSEPEIISVLFDVRTDSEYDDFFVISKADTAAQIENAEYFTVNVKVYLKKYSK